MSRRTGRVVAMTGMGMSVSSHVAHNAARFPETLRLTFQRGSELRYGENPHQGAALYVRQFVPL